MADKLKFNAAAVSRNKNYKRNFLGRGNKFLQYESYNMKNQKQFLSCKFASFSLIFFVLYIPTAAT